MRGRRRSVALAGVLAALLLPVVVLHASSAAHLRVSSEPLQSWVFGPADMPDPVRPPVPTPAPGPTLPGPSPDAGALSPLSTGATVRFASGSAHLSPVARKALRKVAARLWLAQRVAVTAFTYLPGRYASKSAALSAKRARVVVRYLKRRHVTAYVVLIAHGAANPHLRDPKKNRRTVVAYLPRA